MKQRPILFSGEMVRAILEGRKTQTRRVVKPQPPDDYPIAVCDAHGLCCWSDDGSEDGEWYPDNPIRCPYGIRGDRLWVRETWTKNAFGEFLYNADFKSQGYEYEGMGWKPSIHMPRAASRITLEVVKVRVERLQSITCGDVIAEGAMTREEFSTGGASMNMLAKGTYVLESWTNLWDRINEKRGFGWDKNPWVWVIEFKRVAE